MRKQLLAIPAAEETRMGPLASAEQAGRFNEQLQKLTEVTDTVYASGNGKEGGAFSGARVLLCHKPMQVDEVHQLEAFGPMTTIMPYSTTDEAILLANKANGSLVGSLFTPDDDLAKKVTLGCAPYHGRFMVINRHSAGESTGHGSPIASLIHGGPGHAGGGEELGGARSVLHHMQRTALQGSPTTLMNITGQHIKGADTKESDRHPFRKHFEELKIGEHLTTHRRTLTEADIVNFGTLSGDHFYAHFDDVAAKESIFGKRVAHGYLSAFSRCGYVCGSGSRPVMLNYGLEELRFLAPVFPGDTIQVKLIVKKKTVRQQRETDPKPFGMVWFDVEVRNQETDLVAEYTILTLVERRITLKIDEM